MIKSQKCGQLAAIHEAHIDLQARHDELVAWIRLLDHALLAVDVDLLDLALRERQLASLTFNGVTR